MKKSKENKTSLIIGSILLLILVLGIFIIPQFEFKKKNDPDFPIKITNKKTDDWQNPQEKHEKKETLNSIGRGITKNMEFDSSLNISESMSPQNSIGLSTGGAKDVNNFRENIKNNYLPLPTDITYEGLYYDYFFDTAQQKPCQKLFCPSYGFAQTRDPISNEWEYYLQVGLNSGIKETDFKRKKLNLVIALDVSGSMSSPFNQYYYDNNTKNKQEENKSKMDIANESVVRLTKNLKKDDRFGMIIFDSQANLAKPISFVGETDMNAISNHILELQAMGGTNMEDGYQLATSLFEEISLNNSDYDNRIIFLTDAMPNTGAIDENQLLRMTKENANKKIHTTFIGIGLDFNTQLIEAISKIKGSNYYSVHSSEDFYQRMDEEFDYMVTPLVFDLELKFESDDFKISKVYGSPEANQSTGEIMKVNTLFPSAKNDKGTKGGIVVLKLDRLNQYDTHQIKLITSYQDRNGRVDGQTETINLDTFSLESFSNQGLRKGVLLARYANLIKTWILNEREAKIDPNPPVILPSPYERFIINDQLKEIDTTTGIIIPPNLEYLSKWERKSIPLKVSAHYSEIFSRFKNYFANEANAIGDESLKQELEILEKLSSQSTHTDKDGQSQNCSDYHYSNCPMNCQRICQPSCPTCLDCDGPGSCVRAQPPMIN